jgi:hypothetical protein
MVSLTKMIKKSIAKGRTILLPGTKGTRKIRLVRDWVCVSVTDNRQRTLDTPVPQTPKMLRTSGQLPQTTATPEGTVRDPIDFRLGWQNKGREWNGKTFPWKEFRSGKLSKNQIGWRWREPRVSGLVDWHFNRDKLDVTSKGEPFPAQGGKGTWIESPERQTRTGNLGIMETSVEQNGYGSPDAPKFSVPRDVEGLYTPSKFSNREHFAEWLSTSEEVQDAKMRDLISFSK